MIHISLSFKGWQRFNQSETIRHILKWISLLPTYRKIKTKDAKLPVTMWLKGYKTNLQTIKKTRCKRKNKKKMATWKNCVIEDDVNFDIFNIESYPEKPIQDVRDLINQLNQK